MSVPVRDVEIKARDVAKPWPAKLDDTGDEFRIGDEPIDGVADRSGLRRRASQLAWFTAR